jgi:hypothetical protein
MPSPEFKPPAFKSSTPHHQALNIDPTLLGKAHFSSIVATMGSPLFTLFIFQLIVALIDAIGAEPINELVRTPFVI